MPLLQAARDGGGGGAGEVMAGARRKDFHGISFKRRGSSAARFERLKTRGPSVDETTLFLGIGG